MNDGVPNSSHIYCRWLVSHNYRWHETRWIGPIDRIPTGISVEINPARDPDGIGLHEPSQRRRVDAGLVIVHAKLGQPRLAGVLEPPAVGAARDAIFVIGIDRLAIARAVGLGDHRAANVARQQPGRGAAGQRAAGL